MEFLWFWNQAVSNYFWFKIKFNNVNRIIFFWVYCQAKDYKNNLKYLLYISWSSNQNPFKLPNCYSVLFQRNLSEKTIKNGLKSTNSWRIWNKKNWLIYYWVEGTRSICWHVPSYPTILACFSSRPVPNHRSTWNK